MVDVNALGMHAYVAYPFGSGYVAYFKGEKGWVSLDASTDGTVDVVPASPFQVLSALKPDVGFKVMFKGVQA